MAMLSPPRLLAAQLLRCRAPGRVWGYTPSGSGRPVEGARWSVQRWCCQGSVPSGRGSAERGNEGKTPPLVGVSAAGRAAWCGAGRVSKRGVSQNLANLMIGCKAQQTCGRGPGASRRSREERQGRKVLERWLSPAEGQQPSGSWLGQDGLAVCRWRGNLDNPMRGVSERLLCQSGRHPGGRCAARTGGLEQDGCG
jgi:hypothetical protein